MKMEQTIRLADLLRYGLWAAVLGTAVRNRKEYGVPTAWLTHLAGNTVTLLLPDAFRMLPRGLVADTKGLPGALLRTLRSRTWEDPSYAGYAAPLALGFIVSHPDYSIYHGRWAELNVFGFGLDSVPHASAAYGLARLLTETVHTLEDELPHAHALHHPIRRLGRQVDVLATAAVLIVTITWEWSEYLAHKAELKATGRAPEEINMQWSLPDAITDTISNALGLGAAIMVGRTRRAGAGLCPDKAFARKEPHDTLPPGTVSIPEPARSRART